MSLTPPRRATASSLATIVRAMVVLVSVALSLLSSSSVSFHLPSPTPGPLRPNSIAANSATTTLQRPTASPTRLHCICVDCKWVTSCKAYHFVETKHEQPHMSEVPTFLPREGSPTINVNIRTEQRKPQPKAGVVDKSGGMWKHQIRADDGDDVRRDASYYEETGTVEAVSTNTTTTIEYDVVKCADFVLDKGCWVRNMPEEIKRVNPDFVPT